MSYEISAILRFFYANVVIRISIKDLNLTFWHRSFTFNSNKSPTWCNNFSVYYPDICLQLNMFRAFSCPSSGAQWLQWQPLVLPSYRMTVVLYSWSGRPARPRTQHDCHHDTKIKPDAATAVIEFLMMGGQTPEICWAVNKRQDNKLKNCCIRLVIYLNCTMMHGLTNLKEKESVYCAVRKQSALRL
jgi:hypothetical protein